MTDTTIRIYEDNAGAVYLERNGVAWSLGQITPDMYGNAESDAQDWHAGEWEPNETDGQTPADTAGLDVIAEWTPGYGLSIAAYIDRPGLAAGAEGAAYLGIDADAG